MSFLCISQIHSRWSCSEARSCGKPDVLRINSCSCTNPNMLAKVPSMLLLHLEFCQPECSLATKWSPLVSNNLKTHVFHYWRLLKTFPPWKLCSVVIFLGGPLRNQLARYATFELSKYGLISSKFLAFGIRFSPEYQIWIINCLIHEENQLKCFDRVSLKMWPWSRAWFA